MKNLQQEQFLKAYCKKYQLDLIDHPEKNSFTIVKHTLDGDYQVTFDDRDIVLEDKNETLRTLDIELAITKDDRAKAAMNDFYGKLNAAVEGTVLEATYELHFMNRVKNAINDFLGNNPDLTVDEPQETGSVLRWTFRTK